MIVSFPQFRLILQLQLIAIFLINSAASNWWYLGVENEVSRNGVDKHENTTKPGQNSLSFEELEENDEDDDEFESNVLGAPNRAKANFESDLKKHCRDVKFLRSSVQQKLCLRNTRIIKIMSHGARLAMDECKHQFKYKRWNCSTFNQSNVYGGVTRQKSRETAFLYAVNSAAAMFQVTRACGRGELKKCQCDQKSRDENLENYEKEKNVKKNGNEWGGCSDNVLFGYKLSKKFVDSEEHQDLKLIRADVEGKKELANNKKEFKLINLHNNEIGRRTILKNMKQMCKCHGVSGSCSLKVCWKIMPEFRVISDELMKQYNSAQRINEPEIKERIQILKSSNKEIGLKNKLVYVEKSPDYCRKNVRRGIAGTSGRICYVYEEEKKKNLFNPYEKETRSSNEASLQESCGDLCCHRGFYSKTLEREEDCDCQFQWCCEVKCQKCRKKIVQYFCK